MKWPEPSPEAQRRAERAAANPNYLFTTTEEVDHYAFAGTPFRVERATPEDLRDVNSPESSEE